MINLGKKNILGVLLDAVDYESATARVIHAARDSRPLSVSALAVHGVMTGVLDPVHRHRLNQFDLLCPDGQPVRWALNLLHRAALPDRVYGPFLTLRVCAAAEQENLPVFLFGSRPEVLERLRSALAARFPRLAVAGALPSRFRAATEEEVAADVRTIRASQARIVLCGLGCPRQEVWAYEMRDALGLPVLAVGAAFDFLAGSLPMAPPWMQRRGLEWLYRLLREPRRLWRRYLILNPLYCLHLTAQLLRLRPYDPSATTPPAHPLRHG